MKSPTSDSLAQLIVRLERWIEKRRAKQLDSKELADAVDYLQSYHAVLVQAEASINGGRNGAA